MPPKKRGRKTVCGKATQVQVVEPPEHLHDEDDEESQIPLKKKKMHTNLTSEQEEAMVEWLKTNKLLYNKKLDAYKDTKKKKLLQYSLSSHTV